MSIGMVIVVVETGNFSFTKLHSDLSLQPKRLAGDKEANKLRT